MSFCSERLLLCFRLTWEINNGLSVGDERGLVPTDQILVGKKVLWKRDTYLLNSEIRVGKNVRLQNEQISECNKCVSLLQTVRKIDRHSV